ncbi:lipopolysaccharide biosynthesis protein [Flavobacterium sp. WC2409]|uniref:Lipopolysaccharide biosynthesis protein n=1 Tax=Flavobacterium sp. WC2409 TaxID=3234139 RepID=A0AB39W4Y6_9FLAO
MKKIETNKGSSLTKLTAVYMVGNFSSKILSFLLVFVMTYTLSKKEIGEYDLIMTTIFFIVPFVSFQIDASLLRWLLDSPGKEQSKAIFENVFFLLFFNIIVFSIIFFILNIIFTIEYGAYLYVLSVFQIILPTLQQGTRGIGNNKLYAATGVIYSLLYVFTTILFLYVFKFGVEGVLLGNIIAVFIVLILLLYKNKWFKFFKFKKPDLSVLKELINYSLPLLPNSISWWIVGSSTRYIILLYLGVEQNGIFAISYKYPTIIMMLSNVFNLAWQEKAILSNGSGDISKESGTILDQYVKLLLGIIIILSCLSKFLMTHLVSPDFFESWKYMPILLYAVFMQALSAFYGVGYLRSRRTKGAFVSSMLGGIVTLIISFILVKPMGLYGVSLAILLGYLVMLVIRIEQTKKFFPVTFPLKLIVILSFVFFIISCINFYENNYLFILSCITSIGIFIYLNVSYLKKLKLKLIKNR